MPLNMFTFVRLVSEIKVCTIAFYNVETKKYKKPRVRTALFATFEKGEGNFDPDLQGM
jgi:hypothetical protein